MNILTISHTSKNNMNITSQTAATAISARKRYMVIFTGNAHNALEIKIML